MPGLLGMAGYDPVVLELQLTLFAVGKIFAVSHWQLRKLLYIHGALLGSCNCCLVEESKLRDKDRSMKNAFRKKGLLFSGSYYRLAPPTKIESPS